MPSLLATSSCLLLVLSTPVFGQHLGRKGDLQAHETSSLGIYPGTLGSLHALSPGLGGHLPQTSYGLPHTASLSSGSYDDLHKYGGIGKKAHTSSLYDHGSKGYKDYYGNAAYGNQGLNKYSNHHSADHYGGKSGNHANYHDGHVYSRNRGYGYEKHYMYDKEYSTAKHGGSKGGHHSYYGDHKKGGQSSVKAYKNYGGKKFGAKKGHDDHAYGKYGHLVDDHGEHYLKHNSGHPKPLLSHLETHLVPESYVSGHDYVPVIESYGGALGHGGAVSPSYSDHGSDTLLEYDTQSSPSVVYVPSASSSEPETSPALTSKVGTATAPAGANANAALISTKLVPASGGVGAPPVYATLGSTYPRPAVNSAVHATPPAVISTSSGAHYGAHYYNN